MPIAPKKLLSTLAAFDKARKLLHRGDKILAAVSGGPDSVALAHHLVRISKRRGLKIAVIHVHHGLRGRDADRDADLAERLAEAWGVPFILTRVNVKNLALKERRSVEDAARKLRYQAIFDAARKLNCNKAATGHHLDDQAETFILHILRGTKAKGLAGIPAQRPLKPPGRRGKPIEIIRPLLALTRKETVAYCRAYELPFRIDRSNASPRFTRNWVRSQVLPLLASRNPRIREHLAAIADDIRKILG